jgi:hypothetical protein
VKHTYLWWSNINSNILNITKDYIGRSLLTAPMSKLKLGPKSQVIKAGITIKAFFAYTLCPELLVKLVL